MCITVIIHVTAKMAAALQFEICLAIIIQLDLGIILSENGAVCQQSSSKSSHYLIAECLNVNI